MAQFITLLLSLAVLITIVNSRAVEVTVQPSLREAQTEMTSTDMTDTEFGEFESSSMPDSKAEGDKMHDGSNKNVNGSTNTVIIVYVLVVLTIIIKTAPNAIYYLLPKIETEEEKAAREAAEAESEPEVVKDPLPIADDTKESKDPEMDKKDFVISIYTIDCDSDYKIDLKGIPAFNNE